MDKQFVINIETSGKTHGLHFDEFDLGFLGDKRISRASSIEFDEEAQSFFVLPAGYDKPNSIATGFSGYDVARDFEVEWLQACMMAGKVQPHSTVGIVLAHEIRESNPRYNRVHGKSGRGESPALL